MAAVISVLRDRLEMLDGRSQSCQRHSVGFVNVEPPIISVIVAIVVGGCLFIKSEAKYSRTMYRWCRSYSIKTPALIYYLLGIK